MIQISRYIKISARTVIGSKKTHFSFPITYDGEAGAVFIRSNDNQDDVGGVLTEQPDVRRSSTYWAVMKKGLYQKEQTNCLQIVSS